MSTDFHNVMEIALFDGADELVKKIKEDESFIEDIKETLGYLRHQEFMFFGMSEDDRKLNKQLTETIENALEKYEHDKNIEKYGEDYYSPENIAKRRESLINSSIGISTVSYSTVKTKTEEDIEEEMGTIKEEIGNIKNEIIEIKTMLKELK